MPVSIRLIHLSGTLVTGFGDKPSRRRATTLIDLTNLSLPWLVGPVDAPAARLAASLPMRSMARRKGRV
jgi:hypothetical protein